MNQSPNLHRVACVSVPTSIICAFHCFWHSRLQYMPFSFMAVACTYLLLLHLPFKKTQTNEKTTKFGNKIVQDEQTDAVQEVHMDVMLTMTWHMPIWPNGMNHGALVHIYWEQPHVGCCHLLQAQQQTIRPNQACASLVRKWQANQSHGSTNNYFIFLKIKKGKNKRERLDYMHQTMSETPN